MGNTRVESTNTYTHTVVTKRMDDFIAQKKKDGIEYTYRDLVIASLVRVFYLRPRFNRFFYKGVFYQRNFIDIAVVMHKNLKTGERETVVKCRFTGTETLAEIKAKIDNTIHMAMTTINKADDFTNKIGGTLPTWLLRFYMNFMKFADRRGWLSEKFMFLASPMHASVVFGDMKSIHLGPVWHHLYNFGNAGFFATLGKDVMRPIVDPKTNEIRAERVCDLGISEDERFVDGLTFTHMIRTVDRIMDNISVLEERAEEADRKWPYTSKKGIKQREKWAKQDAKRAKRKPNKFL